MALVGIERVAEGGDVHAHELELGGHIRVLEIRTFFPRQACGHNLRHGVAGRDQSVRLAIHRCALADGGDVLDGGSALAVGEEAAARPQFQASVRAHRVARADAGGEDHQVGLDLPVVTQVQHDGPLALRRRLDGATGHPDVDVHAHLADRLREHLAACVIHLQRHEPRGHFYNVCFRAHVLSSACRLKPKEATANHHGGRFAVRAHHALDRGADAIHVIERAVHVHLWQLIAREARHERARAGGKDELLVCEHAAVVKHKLLRLRLDRHRASRHHGDIFRETVEVERLAVPVAHVARELHTVVRVVLSFAVDDGNLRVRAPRRKLLGKTVPNHAEAHDQNLGMGGLRTHKTVLCSRGGAAAPITPDRTGRKAVRVGFPQQPVRRYLRVPYPITPVNFPWNALERSPIPTKVTVFPYWA